MYTENTELCNCYDSLQMQYDQGTNPQELKLKRSSRREHAGGSRDGAVVEHLPPTQASHQFGPGSIPLLGVICGLSLLLVLVLGSERFSPGTPVFPSPQKPTFPNSNSILIIGQALNHEPLAWEIAQALPVLLTLNKLYMHFSKILGPHPHLKRFHVPFSSRRKRSKIFPSTLAFWYRFCLSTLKRSKTMKTTGTRDCACVNITRSSAILNRYSDLDWNRWHVTLFTSPFSKVYVLTCPH